MKQRKVLSMVIAIAMLVSLIAVPAYGASTDATGTAAYGTPELGSNDPLWNTTETLRIDKSTNPAAQPHATGTAKVLWDADFLYVRVDVNDPNLFTGQGGEFYSNDSLEFYVGPGLNGTSQWRVNPNGIFSGGASGVGRVAYTEIKKDGKGYIVEMRLPKKNANFDELKFEENALVSFDVYINNSTAGGGDRYEVVSWCSTPDSAYSDFKDRGETVGYENSLKLIANTSGDTSKTVKITTGEGGTVTPTAIGDVVKAESGKDKVFTITPDRGKVVDALKIDGKAVDFPAAGGKYTFEKVSANHTIDVTFKNSADASDLSFVVYNDNFATGEFTTAVIIDLGAGKSATTAELNSGKTPLFKVYGKNIAKDGGETYSSERKIARVYANDKPETAGYLGTVSNSPNYVDMSDKSGRYIVVELVFFDASTSVTTLDGSSNSTQQVYTVTQLVDTLLPTLKTGVFKQSGVVNPILDQFESKTVTYEGQGSYTPPGGDPITFPVESNYGESLYLHKDANGSVSKGLPLFIYHHGSSRGGTDGGVDQKASMKSANGAVALMTKMMDPVANANGKYNAHVLNFSAGFGWGWMGPGGNVQAPYELAKKTIDALIASGAVDPSRIYMSGFSMGAGFTNSMSIAYPGLFAAIMPLAMPGYPGAPAFMSQEPGVFHDEYKTMGFWLIYNKYNTIGFQNIINEFKDSTFSQTTNARMTEIESNEYCSWPYNQYDQPGLRPNMSLDPPMSSGVAHEVEAAALYNKINDKTQNGTAWSLDPALGTLDSKYVYVFDWLFDQRKNQTDEDTGINVAGIPAETTLVVTEVKDAKAPATGLTKFAAYAISLEKDGVAYDAAGGNYKITLSVPAGFDTSRLAVYAKNGDKNDKIAFTVSGGKITFSPKNLTTFFIAESEVPVVEPPFEVPETGESALPIAIAVLLLLSVCGAVVVSKKRKV